MRTEHKPRPGLVAGLRGHRVSRGQPRLRGRGRGLLPLLGRVLLGSAAAREEHGVTVTKTVTKPVSLSRSRCHGDTEVIIEARAAQLC